MALVCGITRSVNQRELCKYNKFGRTGTIHLSANLEQEGAEC